eukprot:XP_024302918.1 uncharacterized protein LOC401478 isoform X3 [Homo sapiens]
MGKEVKPPVNQPWKTLQGHRRLEPVPATQDERHEPAWDRRPSHCKMYCSAMLGILKNKALSSADTQAADFKDWKKSFASSLFSIQTQSVAANVLQMDRSWAIRGLQCIRHGSMLENCPKDNQDLLEHSEIWCRDSDRGTPLGRSIHCPPALCSVRKIHLRPQVLRTTSPRNISPISNLVACRDEPPVDSCDVLCSSVNSEVPDDTTGKDLRLLRYPVVSGHFGGYVQTTNNLLSLLELEKNLRKK